MTLDKAIPIVATAFENRFDKGGMPYILHCLAVMNATKMYHDLDLMIIAVMHDLIEDTDWMIDDLRKLGFSERVLVALTLLTHDPEVPYGDYIKLIATNEDARRVKMADLEHNSLIMRMKGLRKKDFDRLEKYHHSYEYLKTKKLKN